MCVSVCAAVMCVCVYVCVCVCVPQPHTLCREQSGGRRQGACAHSVDRARPQSVRSAARQPAHRQLGPRACAGTDVCW